MTESDVRNPTAFPIAQVSESEIEDDNLRLEQFLVFLDSEFDGVDEGHEVNATVLHLQEGIAGIRSCRERGVRKRNFDNMVYY